MFLLSTSPFSRFQYAYLLPVYRQHLRGVDSNLSIPLSSFSEVMAR